MQCSSSMQYIRITAACTVKMVELLSDTVRDQRHMQTHQGHLT